MAEFLSQIAAHYSKCENLSKRCFVFPGKRSVSFFKKHLAAQVALAGKTVIAPNCITVSELFGRLSGGQKIDRIRQLLVLYDCYCRLNPKAEPLDAFLYWGGVILADFGDVDKYLADPEKLWKNVSEFKSLQDLSFLSEEQQKAISEFLGHFDSTDSIKDNFLQIWNILLPLYNSFNEALRKEGFLYEGQMYRTVAQLLESESVVDMLDSSFEPGSRFVFVGLNALNECEKLLLSKMKKAGVAEFCWDFSSPEIVDPENKSSFFMSENIERFGQAFPLDPSGLERPEINVVSVPSAIGQAKSLPEILRRLGPPHDIHTAIVLPDEGLLEPVLNSIPSDISQINVTMGYPIKNSEWMGLINSLGALQSNTRETPQGLAFYHKIVWAIFSNGVFRSALSPEDGELINSIKAGAKYYIPAADFCSGPAHKVPEETQASQANAHEVPAEPRASQPKASASLLEAIFCKSENNAEYLKNIILTIVDAIRLNPDRSIEMEFAMYTYKALNHLQELSLPVQTKTWWKLLNGLLCADSVPFQGEPLRGLQIMGPLETRTLDFDNLIILSCNEGMFPRRSVSASFIPAELRKGFGLPTYEYQDAIWAYYFYRSLQRAKRVWLLCDSRTEGVRSGEESRFIKQLELLYGFPIQRSVLSSKIKTSTQSSSIPKSEEDLKKLLSPDFYLSASSLKNYINCPVSFYYSKILGLKETDDVKEAMDAGMLGTTLHLCMRAFYSTNPLEAEEDKLVALQKVSKSYLKGLLANKDGLHSQIQFRMKQILCGAPEISGRNLVYEEIIYRYVRQILTCDLHLLEEKGLPYFNILGLELYSKATIGGFHFGGVIDRLDSFDPGTLRIVDYKTGKVQDEEIEVNAENCAKLLDALFGGDNSKRPTVALQMFIYDKMQQKQAGGKMLLNSVYQMQRLFVEGIKDVPICKEFATALEEQLTTTLSELKDPSHPWERTPEPKNCEYCDFKNICGR